MASISDVEGALVDAITAVLYPNGSPPSAVGFPVIIYAGWPDPGTLDTDLTETAPNHPTAAHVSIYPLPAERNTTRYPATRTENPLPVATYTLAGAGLTITVGGNAPGTYFPQNLAAFINGKPYITKATTGQTAASIAAALQALIVADVAGAAVVGAVITLPAGTRIGALRVGVTGSSQREVRRQERQFQISVWSSSPASRSAVADAFDPVLADTAFLSFPDGSSGRLTYHGSREDDGVQKAKIYRRSLTYLVEYATTLTETAAQMVVGQVDATLANTTALPTVYS